VNGLELADAVKTRLTAQITGRTIYKGGVPDGAPPPRYIVVWTSEGDEESARASGTVSIQTPTLWVTCVSRNVAPEQAGRESGADAAAVRRALRNWRPQTRWAVKAESSQPARRDESISTTTFMAVEQFSLRSTAA